MAVKFVVFDFANRELRTARFHFIDAASSVTTIQAGQHLATIVFAALAGETILAPAGCAGVIESTNRCIPYDELDDRGICLLSPER